MGKVLRLVPAAEIDTQASLWLSRLDRTLSQSELDELSGWLAQDARHGRALVALARAWDELESLRALSGLVDLRQLQDRRSVDQRYRFAMAAGLGCLGLAAALFFGAQSRLSPGAPTASNTPQAVVAPSERGAWTATLATDVGERQTASLPDGSMLTLNTRTSIRAQKVAAVRRVELLEGEATFEVAHDPAHPFVVIAGGREIRAVGTRFNVRKRSNQSISVIVTEGKVAIEPARGASEPGAPVVTLPTQVLAAGERLDADASTSQVSAVSGDDIGGALAWHDGVIVFQGESLEQALAEVSRYSPARFVIEDPKLRNTRIAGVYRTDDLESFLESLRSNLGLAVTARRGEVYALSSP